MKLSQQEQRLEEVSEKSAALLTAEVCQRGEPAETLRQQILKLGSSWHEEREKLQLSLRDLGEKVGAIRDVHVHVRTCRIQVIVLPLRDLVYTLLG